VDGHFVSSTTWNPLFVGAGARSAGFNFSNPNGAERMIEYSINPPPHNFSFL
jgi:hypothetical protein